MNGDGNLDIVAAYAAGPRVWLGDGKGKWQRGLAGPAGAGHPRPLLGHRRRRPERRRQARSRRPARRCRRCPRAAARPARRPAPAAASRRSSSRPTARGVRQRGLPADECARRGDRRPQQGRQAGHRRGRQARARTRSAACTASTRYLGDGKGKWTPVDAGGACRRPAANAPGASGSADIDERRRARHRGRLRRRRAPELALGRQGDRPSGAGRRSAARQVRLDRRLARRSSTKRPEVAAESLTNRSRWPDRWR